MKLENKSGIFIIIFLAVIFGIAGGIAGELIARSYLLSYNIPFRGEINFSNEDYGGASLIIRDAKKVVVEQDAKVIETINSVDNSLVGIFKKQNRAEFENQEAESTSSPILKIQDYYQINQEAGQGFIITSDGWIVTNTKLVDALNNYLVITKDKKIYTIDEIVRDDFTGFNFLHVGAKDFSVRKFIGLNEIQKIGRASCRERV